MACHNSGLAVDRAWGMTLADLVLTAQPPKEETKVATDKYQQYAMLVELDERIKLRESLTLEERIELEEFKARVM